MSKQNENRSINNIIVHVDDMYHYFYLECLITHVIYLIFFQRFHIYPMVLYNIFSICLYALLAKKPLHRNLNIFVLIMHLEILLHAGISVVLLGWQFGFQYLIFILISMAALKPYENIRGNYFYAVVEIIIMFLLRLYTNRYPPVYINEVISRQETWICTTHLLGTMINVLYLVIINNNAHSMTRKVLMDTNLELEKMASIDPLTGLFNRRALQNEVEQYQKQTGGSGEYCVALGDIDNFKRINDTYGHDAGDFILCKAAEILREYFHDGTVICRWGGEEILLFMPQEKISTASLRLKEVCERIMKSYFIYNNSKISFTMTFGVHECKNDDGFYLAVLAADQGMYRGKQNGKNQVVCNI